MLLVSTICHLEEARIWSEASRASVCSGVALACVTAILLAFELGPNVDFRFGDICSYITCTLEHTHTCSRQFYIT